MGDSIMEDSNMEDSVEMTSSDNSVSARPGGVLEINLDLLPRYNPARNRIASPSPSICSPYLSNGLHSRISDPNSRSQLGRKFGNTRFSNVLFNLEKMLNDKEWDYSDADIVVDGNSIGVNRFVLASTCSFFHQLFSKHRATGEGRPKFYISELVPAGMVRYEAFLLILEYLYTGDLKAYPRKVSTCIDDSCSHENCFRDIDFQHSTCVDDSCSHEICFPAIDFQLQLLYASATFQIDELVSSLQRELLDILNEVATDDILRILSVANMCGKDCERLLAKCIELVVKSEVDLATLDKTLPQEIVKQIVDSHLEFSLDVPKGTNFPDEHVNRIHRALDLGDVKLVRMLLEKHTSLVDAHALHYAVAFCDSKTTRELLDLSLADVNNRNSRGYTVLHVAARRKDPQIIVSLLTKGARPFDLTPDHRKALQIAKRTTRAADYYKSTEEGKHAPNERLCIEVLEQAERGDTLPGDVSHFLPLEGDGLRMKLLYLNIPKDLWEHCTEDEFRSAFRMSKATFNFICEELNSVVRKNTMLREAIPVKQRVAVCIWSLAMGEWLQLVSKRFSLGISTCHEIILEVCTAIKTVLMPKFLVWPEGERMDRIKREYETISGIRNIGGSMYTTHVPIVAPIISVADYYNKRHTERNQKTSYTITIQGVTDCRGVFTDVCIGWPGSMPDDKVFEESALFHRANRGLLNDVWIVGNSGYSLMDWILVPYNQQNLTWTQHALNEKVFDVQRVAKDAFARLKGRWGCLQKRTEMKLQDLPMVFGACCVLHNICEMKNEEMSSKWNFEIFDDEMVAENSVRSTSALQARDHIAHDLLHHGLAGTSFS